MPDMGAKQGMSNVLIVDDVPDITHTMSILLQLRGHRTVEAFTGAQAIQLMSGRGFDAFLVDISLPDISGIEVARAIRSRYGQRPKILAITGWGNREMRIRCLGAGFDYHVTKPADGRRIIALIERDKS
jgi:DNA-binding response OmpR family regulator